jgi:hypothetical protein
MRKTSFSAALAALALTGCGLFKQEVETPRNYGSDEFRGQYEYPRDYQAPEKGPNSTPAVEPSSRP